MKLKRVTKCKRHLVIVTFCRKQLIDNLIYCVYFSQTDILNR